jgi:undecaprenyl-diphosphatase
MLFRGLLLAAALLGWATSPTAAEIPTVQAQPVKESITWTDAIVLGVVEGITEFLPVSSTGHLIITNWLLGLDDDTPLFDAAGRPRWEVAPTLENPEGVPLTLKSAADTYAVIIQIGGILAVLVLYWRQVWSAGLGVLGLDREGGRLARNLFVALVPAAVLGLTLKGWIQEHLFSVGTVVAALVVGAIIMLVVDRWQRRTQWSSAASRRPCDLSVLESLFVGAMQCLALWPGMSRSMVTIVGGYLAGLAPARAAEFSFLLGLPTLGGAALIAAVSDGPAMIEVLGWGHVVLGTVVAALAGAAAVKFLVAALTRFGLAPFAIYRLLLAGALGVFLLR